MSVPKKRRTKASKGRRASHFALSDSTILACPNCKKPVRPHHACPSCGTYKGKTLAHAPASVAEKAETTKEEKAPKTTKAAEKKETPKEAKK